MRHLTLVTSLALGSLALAACSDQITEPKAAGNAPSATVQALASNTWLIRAHMPTKRTEVASATVTNSAGQSIVYAIGGRAENRLPSEKVTAYNVATNTWTFRRPLPLHLTGTNGAGVIDGKIYVSGGYSQVVWQGDWPTNSLYVYDPARNTWTRKSDMPGDVDPYGEFGPGGYGVTGVIGGKLYVVTQRMMDSNPWGYSEARGGPLFFRYNPATDKWVNLPDPFPSQDPEPSVGSPYAGGVIDGKFYVMGGSYPNAKFSVYDPATNQWTPKTPLGRGRPGAATAVLGGKLYVMGGFFETTESRQTVDITVVYDPATDTWTRQAPLPSPRSDISASRVFVGGKARIEVVGGWFDDNNVQYVP